jgi:hypothetical protein
MADWVWLLVSGVAVSMLWLLLIVVGAPLVLVFAGWLFAGSALLALGQVGRE